MPSVPHRVVARGARLIVVALLATVLAPAVGATGAAADEGSTAGSAESSTTQPSTWSIQPATAKGPDRRPYFTMTTPAGQRVIEYVAVSNHSTKPLQLRLYATDAFNTSAGDFSLLASGEEPTGAGSWVTLKKQRLTVPARSRTIVPLSVTIPAGTRPGDHAGGIVASLVTDTEVADGGKLAVEQRVGTRLYVRVLGEMVVGLDVTDVRTTYHATANPLSGSATVTWTVQNTGTVRITAAEDVEVTGPFGLLAKQSPTGQMPELLPGESVTFSRNVSGVPATVRVRGTVTVTPVVLGTAGDELAPVSGSASTWAISWIAVLVVVLVVGVVVLVRRLRGSRAGNDVAREEPQADPVEA